MFSNKRFHVCIKQVALFKPNYYTTNQGIKRVRMSNYNSNKFNKLSSKERDLLSQLQGVLPQSGKVFCENDDLTPVLCKPKILPLKSVTLEKIEEMERKANEKLSQTKNSLKI